VSTRTMPLRRMLALAVIPAVVLVSSCSKSQSALCQDAQTLKDSVQALTQVDFQTGGAEALSTAVDNVKAAAGNLGDEAKTTFGSQIASIQTQLTALGAAVDQVKGGASVASVAPTVLAALTAMKTSLSDLKTTAQDQNCELK
jgi:hypothetical protein